PARRADVEVCRRGMQEMVAQFPDCRFPIPDSRLPFLHSWYSLLLRVTFLGTGTSHGVPMIGCSCDVCRSPDPRDQRLRPSVLIETNDGLRLLVDTTPDLRQQALRAGLDRVDAILFTHAHADHVMGLDEVRRFNVLSGRPMPVFASASTQVDLRRTFAYVFESDAPKGGGVPDLRLWTIGGPFSIGGLEVTPVPIDHGPWHILGFRFGAFAYLTDCSRIPDSSWPLLDGVHTVILDALRRRPHSTHFSVDEALAVVARLGAARAYFTHISHDLGHADTCAALPRGVELAYDGQVIEIDQ
ncbi:MAG: MBL fold metallo-hydrolase, partial [Gemmatimonadaceae bacterium]